MNIQSITELFAYVLIASSLYCQIGISILILQVRKQAHRGNNCPSNSPVRVRIQSQVGLALKSMLIALPWTPLGTPELRLQLQPTHAALTATAFSQKCTLSVHSLFTEAPFFSPQDPNMLMAFRCLEEGSDRRKARVLVLGFPVSTLA